MDIRRSDLPLLIALDVLLEESNVTRAAKRLHLSQPALSAQLARLRELFDDPLLVPSESGRGMAPTDQALALQPRLHQALRDLQDAVLTDGAFDPMAAERTFTIAINDHLFNIVGVTAARMILACQAPGIRLSFIAPSGPGMAPRMERGEIDLHVGLAGLIPQGLKSRRLLTDELRMAQRRGHPRGATGASLEEYCRLAHVMVSPAGSFHSSIDDTLQALGQRRTVTVAVARYNQVVPLLLETDSVATLPARFLQRHAASLDILPMPFKLPSFDLVMAWHPRAQPDPAHQWLRERFVEASELPVERDVGPAPSSR